MAIPYTFASVTTNQPGSTLDANFTYVLGQIPTLTAGTGISITGGPNYTIATTGSAGTVTSVAASGGTTGLTFSGSPITSSGTLTLGGTLTVANGGTGLVTLTPYAVIVGGTTSVGNLQQVASVGSSGQALISAGASKVPVFGVPVLRSYIAGLTLSTAGSSATFGIAAGQTADSTNVSMMALATAYTKTTSPWAVGSGNGALDVQANVINTSWYHVYLIQRVDTGVVDVLVSQAPGISATATITIASPGVVTVANHGLQISAPVVFGTTGALPTGLVAGTIYYVQSVPTVNTFTVSASQGGSVINTTGSQSGVQTLIANPILPTNYTLFRRIGSMLTSGSGQWVGFVQNGDEFQWAIPLLDISTSVQSSTAILYQLTVPSGISVSALTVGTAVNASGFAVLFSSPLTTDTAPATSGIGQTGNGGIDFPITEQVRTNTSQQIRVRSTTSSTSIFSTTQGWIDSRGRNN